MKYFVTERLDEDIQKGLQRNAGGKAREDIRKILLSERAQEVSIVVQEHARGASSALRRMDWHRRVANTWKEALSTPGAGDIVYLQYPIRDHTVFGGSICKSLRKRGVTVVLLLHDLNILRENKRDIPWKKKLRLYLEEVAMLRSCSYIITHNDCMTAALEKLGIAKEKCIPLGIFDYLADAAESKARDYAQRNTVAIAGNLAREKAGYAYRLPKTETMWNLYGTGFAGTETDTVHYRGSYLPEELPNKLEGGFGLVWDGESEQTCSGIYGAYLRINNPHKTSLYLSAGLPVLIWREAALAAFVKENRCGICINNLAGIDKTLRTLDRTEYEAMVHNAERVSEQLRTGYFTQNAIREIDRRIKGGEKQ